MSCPMRQVGSGQCLGPTPWRQGRLGAGRAVPCGRPGPQQQTLSRASFLSQVLSLQDLCCRAVVSCTPVHLVDKLPLPVALSSHLKSFSVADGLNARMMHGRSFSLAASAAHKRSSVRRGKGGRPPPSPPRRSSCKVF